MANGKRDRSLIGALRQSARAFGTDVREVLSDPREEVITRYTRGTGKFSPDKRFITLRMKMYRWSGEEDGFHEGVWEAAFSNPTQLITPPPVPTGPMDEPVGPVPHIAPLAYTKARWVFGDEQQSSIVVIGPATTNLTQLNDGTFLFSVITAQVITGGTGRYEGAYGLVQSLGSTHVKGNIFDPKYDEPFIATTIDTFRVVRGRYYSEELKGQLLSRGPGPGSGGQQPGQPPPGGEKKNLAELRYTPKSVEVLGSKMSYLEAGSGDPILFIHGNPTWSYLWRNVMPHLESRGRCIAVDLIGMGKSDKPDVGYSFDLHSSYLEAFIRKLKLKNITLVVHDWGSGLGFHYAMRAPQNVKGLVFMEALLKPYDKWSDFPAKGDDPVTSQIRQTFRHLRTEQGREMIVGQNAMVENITNQVAVDQSGRPVQLPPGVMERYREPFAEKSSRELIWRWVTQIPVAEDPEDVAAAVADYSEKLRESDLPKLLIYGTPGIIVTRELVEWCKANLNNLDLVEIPGGLHFLQEADPDRIGRAIADWYDRKVAGGK